jgi:membrane protein
VNQPLKVRAQALKRTAQERVIAVLEARALGRGLVKLARGLRRHHVGTAASAMAFDLFLATIPMLALAGWLVALVLRSDERALGSTSLLLDLTPIEVHTLTTRHLGRAAPVAIAPLVFLGSLWVASSAFVTLMNVFEVAIGAARRPWWRKRLIAVGCVFAAIVAFIATGFLAVQLAGGPAVVFRFLRAGEQAGAPIGRAIGATVALVAATATLAGFFRIAVHRPGVDRRVWPGAALTIGIGGVASYLFGYYVKNLASYSLVYGSIATVAVVLAWLWIWCLALLIGAELNAQLEGGDRDLA